MKSLSFALIFAAIVALALARPQDTATETKPNYEELQAIIDNLIKSDRDEDAEKQVESVMDAMKDGFDSLGDLDAATVEYCANRTGVTEDDAPAPGSISFYNLPGPVQCMFTCIAEQKGVWKDGHVSGPLAILKSLTLLIITKFPDLNIEATKWAAASYNCLNIVDENGCDGFMEFSKCMNKVQGL